MDTLRGRDNIGDSQEDFDYAAEDPAIEAPPEIDSNERRMHVRAYNFWTSLLGDRALPSIEDLDPANLGDFGPHSVLLDFSAGIDDPAVVYLGNALRRECEIDEHIEHISDIPARSLLSRLTDHCLQIVANAAPIGFEAEFINQRGAEIMYRGILMPFSSDDETIDFVYGVINWKEMASQDLTDALVMEVDKALRSAPTATSARPVWADGPSGSTTATDHDMLVDPPADFDLADRLALARDCALEAAGNAARTRNALYRAIGLAHDFALAARDEPQDYTEMLEDAGIVAQARSPMTAVVKLVFGADYDKTRLTEYATVLDHALTTEMAPGSLAAFLEAHPGGIKGLVAEARAARKALRPPEPDMASVSRTRLKVRAAIDTNSVQTDSDGLAVLVARREADGTLSIIAALPAEGSLTRQVVGKAGL
jgi:hypothetical protein